LTTLFSELWYMMTLVEFQINARDSCMKEGHYSKCFLKTSNLRLFFYENWFASCECHDLRDNFIVTKNIKLGNTCVVSCNIYRSFNKVNAHINIEIWFQIRYLFKHVKRGRIDAWWLFKRQILMRLMHIIQAHLPFYQLNVVSGNNSLSSDLRTSLTVWLWLWLWLLFK